MYFVVVGVISIAIVSLFSIFEAKKGVTNRTFSQLVLLRDLRREQIQTFFETRTNELKHLAVSAGMIEMANAINDKENREVSLPSVLKDQRLPDLVTDTTFCKSFYFVPTRGTTYRYNTTGKYHEFVTEEIGITFDTNLVPGFTNYGKGPDHIIFEQLSPLRALQVFIAVPVFQNNIYCGALVTEILPEAINSILFNKNPGTGLGKTGEAYLVGLDGMMRSPSRFVPGAVLNVTVNSEGFKKALDRKEGVGIYKDYRGVEVLGAYGYLEEGGASRIILAEIDLSEAMVPLVVIRNEIMFLSLIIVLAIFAIAWFVAYGITRPLVRLKNAANFITLGNYNQQLEVNVDDEIGELTRAFNAMAREINTTTQELRDNEELLHHYYRANLDGQDIERQRLSRELHDGLGQQLVAGKLMLESSLYAEDADLKQKILEAQGVFDLIIGDIRRISHNLSPSILQEFGLRAAMENLCNNIMKSSGIRIDFHFDMEDRACDEMTSTYLFRIAQESLNNAQRHSGAKTIKVLLLADPNEIILEIDDDGCGFQMKEASKQGGNGLYNIRERVRILNGNLSIKSSPGKGTKIQVKVPFVNK